MSNEIDFERLQPLRVAVGSHKAGSGFGCAMNVISYINGDSIITDYPECSDRRLALLVQIANDALGKVSGAGEAATFVPHPVTGLTYLASPQQKLLTPEDALAVIELGLLTIGTVDYPEPYSISYRRRALQNNLMQHVSVADRYRSQADVPLPELIDGVRELLLEIRAEMGLGAAPGVEAVKQKLVSA